MTNPVSPTADASAPTTLTPAAPIGCIPTTQSVPTTPAADPATQTTVVPATQLTNQPKAKLQFQDISTTYDINIEVDGNNKEVNSTNFLHIQMLIAATLEPSCAAFKRATGIEITNPERLEILQYTSATGHYSYTLKYEDKEIDIVDTLKVKKERKDQDSSQINDYPNTAVKTYEMALILLQRTGIAPESPQPANYTPNVVDMNYELPDDEKALYPIQASATVPTAPAQQQASGTPDSASPAAAQAQTTQGTVANPTATSDTTDVASPTDASDNVTDATGTAADADAASDTASTTGANASSEQSPDPAEITPPPTSATASLPPPSEPASIYTQCLTKYSADQIEQYLIAIAQLPIEQSFFAKNHKFKKIQDSTLKEFLKDLRSYANALYIYHLNVDMPAMEDESEEIRIKRIQSYVKTHDLQQDLFMEFVQCQSISEERLDAILAEDVF